MNGFADRINYTAYNPNAAIGGPLSVGTNVPGAAITQTPNIVPQVASIVPQVNNVGGNIQGNNQAAIDLSSPLGVNFGTGQLALGAIGTIGNLWSSWRANKLANEQFNFQKGITNTNLANQIQNYNTVLTDMIKARGYTQGDSQATIDQYIRNNSIRDHRSA